MVRGFGGSLDRDQPFIPGCIDIPLFFILVIGTARGEEDSRFNQISVINPKVSFFFSNYKKFKKRKNRGAFGPQRNSESGPTFTSMELN